jgi:hypothetical protein
MQRSADRILTTHVGKLPAPDDLVEAMLAHSQRRPLEVDRRHGLYLGELHNRRDHAAAAVRLVDEGQGVGRRLILARVRQQVLRGAEGFLTSEDRQGVIADSPTVEWNRARVDDLPGGGAVNRRTVILNVATSRLKHLPTAVKVILPVCIAIDASMARASAVRRERFQARSWALFSFDSIDTWAIISSKGGLQVWPRFL